MIKTNQKLSILSLTLLLSLGLNAKVTNHYMSDQTAFTIEAPQDKEALRSALLKRVLNQVNNIDKAIEEIAQALNNKVIKVKNKQEVHKFLIHLRSSIAELKAESQNDASITYLNSLIEFSKDIMADLYEAFNSNLESLKLTSHKLNSSAYKHKQSENCNLEALQLKYAFNKNLIKKFKTIKFDKIAQTNQLDKIITKTDAFLKDWNIKKIFWRSLPYAAFAGYLTTQIEDAKLPVALLKLKRTLLYPFKTSQPQPQPQAQTDATNNKPTSTYRNTLVGNTLSTLKNASILGIDSRPFINLSLVGLFMKKIQNDFKDLQSFASKKTNKIISQLRAQDEKPLPMFKSIIGYNNIKEELSNIVYHFENLSLMERTGINFNKNIILEGNLDLSNNLAKATVGEISNLLKAKNKKCALLEIHATDLTDKKLKEIIEKSGKAEPMVILIQELDLINHNIEHKTLSNLVKDLDKLNQNKKVVIIATTTNKNDIVKNILPRFSRTISLATPNAEQRSEFINQQIQNYCLDKNNFNLSRLTNKSNGYSYEDIAQWFKKAQVKAHQNRSVLSEEFLIKSL